MREYKYTDQLLMKYRIKVDAIVRRMHVRKVHSSGTVKLDQLHLRLLTLLIKHKYKESKVNQNTVNNIANITGRKWWFSLDLSALIHHK